MEAHRLKLSEFVGRNVAERPRQHDTKRRGEETLETGHS